MFRSSLAHLLFHLGCLLHFMLLVLKIQVVLFRLEEIFMFLVFLRLVLALRCWLRRLCVFFTRIQHLIDSLGRAMLHLLATLFIRWVIMVNMFRATFFFLLLLVDLPGGSNWGSICNKLHEFVVEDASDFRWLLLGPFLALIVNILHKALNELVLSVVLKVETFVLGGLDSILRCVDELTAFVYVQSTHYFKINICICHQLNLANAEHLRLWDLTIGAGQRALLIVSSTVLCLVLLSIFAHASLYNWINLVLDLLPRILVCSLLCFLFFQLNCVVEDNSALFTALLITFEVLNGLVVGGLTVRHHIFSIHRIFKFRLSWVNWLMVYLELKFRSWSLAYWLLISFINRLGSSKLLVSPDWCESRI